MRQWVIETRHSQSTSNHQTVKHPCEKEEESKVKVQETPQQTKPLVVEDRDKLVIDDDRLRFLLFILGHRSKNSRNTILRETSSITTNNS